MAQIQGTSTASGGRIDGSLQKNTVVAGDFALGAGWGGAATIAVATGSTDQRGQITITASTTTPAQATATVVFTFADGAFATAPRTVILTTTNDNSLTAYAGVAYSVTTTALTMTYSILPVDAKVYKINYLIIP